MTAKILEGVGGKVAENWFPALLSSPFLFWVGGLVITLQKFGWRSALEWLGQQPEPIQLGVLVVGLGGAIASAFLVERFEFGILRGLEGYWHPLFDPLKKRRIQHYQRQQHRLEADFQRLRAKTTRSPEDNQKLLQIHGQLDNLPLDLDAGPTNPYLMPTRLGNILRAYERKSFEKYGLDAIVCWPRLWCLLPDTARNDISTARAELNAAVRLFIWSLLFWVWIPWSGWALPIGAVSAWTAYRWAIAAAQTYGILIETAFDLYRAQLYLALRLPLPLDSAQEWEKGYALTQYLRNATGATLSFSTGDRGEPESN
ncbi:MAG: hypothetical protein MH825_02970 [Cyanobacteria bacterium]|nr:hypothetical protein [Cyanobacteriota bacterium]